MIIQHNMTAANANRQLAMAGTNLAKSTEKLSSGYRINRASDDAAGLSISEKMRGQIRGLSQASTNAQDGISMIQTAEGALSESQAILQRMRELSVQASNGTETDEDRANINDEITQLQDELNRISETTEFNTMKLLDGSLEGVSDTLGVSSTAAGAVTPIDAAGAGKNTGNIGLTAAAASSAGDTSEAKAVLNIKYKDASGAEKTIKDLEAITTGGTPDTEVTVEEQLEEIKSALEADTDFAAAFDIEVNEAGDGLKFTAKNATGKAEVTEFKINSGTTDNNKTPITLNNNITANLADVAGVKEKADVNLGAITAVTNASDSDKVTAATIQVGDKKVIIAGDASVKEALLKQDKDAIVVLAGANAAATAQNFKDAVNSINGYKAQDGTPGHVIIESNSETAAKDGVTLQVGANEGQTMSFTINDMGAKALGVDAGKVSVKTQQDAQKATTTIDNAIKSVSKERAKLGAVQNRLEHTISNLDTSAENLQTAESRIRDVNMADEMVKYSKHSILQQASQSMLAQAKNSTQGVLSLLQ